MRTIKNIIKKIVSSRQWELFIRIIDAYATRVWMFIISLILTFALFSISSQNRDIKEQADKTRRISIQNARLLRAQRFERARNIYNNCHSLNDRNAEADRESRRTINLLISRLPKERQLQAQASKRFTFIIIDVLVDTLAPSRDCEIQVKRQVRLTDAQFERLLVD